MMGCDNEYVFKELMGISETRYRAWVEDEIRLVTRWERRAENFLGFLRLGCICIFLRQF